ncbi:MAG: hypothetical protein ABSD74_14425 [Rhizomicrobium sp.]
MTRYGRVIVRIGGVIAIGLGVVSFFVGAINSAGPAQVFIPWGVAYLILGVLMMFAARKL